jgi:hypothetical protein
MSECPCLPAVKEFAGCFAAAQAWCDKTYECAAFTFESAHARPALPVTVWFKRISYTDTNGRG